MDGPRILQLCPFSPYFEAELSGRADRVAWHTLSRDDQESYLVQHGASVTIVVTGGHIGCTTELADRLPNLGLIAINGVGFDKVDLMYCKARGIAVATTPGALTADVADLAVGLTICLLRQLPIADKFVRDGKWETGDRPLARKVTGCRFGIVGLGQIGTAIAARLSVLGSVAYTGRNAKPDQPYRFDPELLSLARDSDVLVLACSATPENQGLVGSAVLEALGTDGYLVNVARGSVVDEGALIDALEHGTIAGAALDVFADEPHVHSALRESANTVLTPHIASATFETRVQMADMVLANVDAFLIGKPLPTGLKLS